MFVELYSRAKVEAITASLLESSHQFYITTQSQQMFIEIL